MMGRTKYITVQELIEQLRKCDPDAMIGVYGKDGFLARADEIQEFDCPYYLHHPNDNTKRIVAISIEGVKMTG